MKKIYYFILYVYFFGCAVQGPISGGPVDKTPPVLLSVFPENLSTEISDEEKIVLIFNELIDPMSFQKSISINNQDFKVKIKGKKVILYPSDKWNPNFLINIYINRDLSDYQKNNLKDPIDLFYSLGDGIPSNTIHGKIVDIKDVINTYNGINDKTFFEVGLFRNSYSGKQLIKKVDSNDDLEFFFNAIEDGSYSIVAVEDKLIDINKDIFKNRYSILNDIIISSSDIDSLNLRLNIADPILKQEISSINFINQYYVNYTLSDNTIKAGIIDTIYNNFNQSQFSGQLMETSLIVKNNFESYSTDIFEFIIPEIVDTISPVISSVIIDEIKFSLEFSEPLKEVSSDQLFYLINDSDKVYMDYKFEDSILKNIISFNIDQVTQYNIPPTFNLNIEKNIIKDLYQNTFLDSIVAINLDNKINTNIDIGTSKIFGKILYNDNISNPLAVALYNTETLETILTLADGNHHFLFKGVIPGDYLLQCYENYNLSAEIAYPYFSGKADLDQTSLRFSNIFGPVEARANWDIKDIIIELK